MAQNTLKQKAREFAKTHSVSYLIALKAVDEPLHELRDLIYSIRLRSDSLQEHFRLIGDRGPFSPAFPMPETDEYTRFGEYSGTLQYHRELIGSDPLTALSEEEFFIAFGQRTALIRDSKAADIWEYRELQRAGLLGEDATELHPIFHHYSMKLSDSFGALIYSGSKLGIFGVNTASYVQITRFNHIAVTLEQLRALQQGDPLDDPVEFSLSHQPREGERRLRWTESYVAAYSYFDEYMAGPVGPGLTLLLRSPIADLDTELAARGLDFGRFEEIKNFDLGVELPHALSRDMLTIGSGDKTHHMATPGFLVLG